MTQVLDPPTSPARRLPKPVGMFVVVLVVLALLAGIGFSGRALYRSAFGVSDYTGTGSGRVVVRISPGDSTSQIGTLLLAKDVVKSVQAFTRAAAGNEKARAIQPGYYTLKTGMSGVSALLLLLDPLSGPSGRVTLPEGIPLATVVDRLVRFAGVKREAVLAALRNTAALGLPVYAGGQAEGFLFPATYDVEPGTAAANIFPMLTDKFAEVAAAIDLESRAKAMRLTPYDVVKIASLVEAETPLDADRPKVARVVLNRLALNMPLQFDSTVNYFRTERKARLSLNDIAVESPYNTYLNKGLPPTPINSPGLKALEAALTPAQGNYLYFITIDKKGNSLFTASYSEFLAAKAKAQRDGVY